MSERGLGVYSRRREVSERGLGEGGMGWVEVGEKKREGMRKRGWLGGWRRERRVKKRESRRKGERVGGREENFEVREHES